MTMILDTSIGSLGEYLELKKQQQAKGNQDNCGNAKKGHQLLVPGRPQKCHECGKSECFWVHSYWYRWAIEGELETIVPVPRYECRFCTNVISVLFAFLVPYRQFTVRAIANSTEKYILEETSYRSVAGELGDESYRPAHSQVWQWVQLFVSKVQDFLGLKLQYACVECGKNEEQLFKAGQQVCPNAENAASPKKAAKLNLAARVLGLAGLLIKQKTDLILALQTYFVGDVQSQLSIFTGRGIRLLTPQSSKHVF
jgi:hypothetical protein